MITNNKTPTKFTFPKISQEKKQHVSEQPLYAFSFLTWNFKII